MRLSPILALLILSAFPSRANDAPLLPKGQSQEARPRLAPQLLHLERALIQQQEARDKRALPPEKYQTFIAQFRTELDAVMGRISPTPENKGLHAQILARLGEQETDQALESLQQALAGNPENPALLVAKGSILHEQKDYQAAATLARQAWEASSHKDARAWALLKMSEGRISGTVSTEPAPRLKPASDFAQLDWSIPDNHDINVQAMGFIQQAIAARNQRDMAATWSNVQAAMNADPTSVAVQKLYEAAKADQSKHADTKAFLDKAVASMREGRPQDSVAWAQRAYDRNPTDDTYAILQEARRRNAEALPPRPAEPKKAPVGSSPLLPILLFGGAGLAAYGGYQVSKSKGTRTADEGLDPAPYVSQEQARRNYVNSAVYIGAPLVIFGLVYGGPIVWRAAAPVVTKAWQQLRGSAQHVATSEAGALFPGEASAVSRTAQRAPSALQGAQLREHMRQLQRYGADGFRELEDGAIRYYGQLRNARTPGDMAGQRVVREWNPATGSTRTWLETIDRAGNVRIVRPETGASKVHYYFNEAGEYIGSK